MLPSSPSLFPFRLTTTFAWKQDLCCCTFSPSSLPPFLSGHPVPISPRLWLKHHLNNDPPAQIQEGALSDHYNASHDHDLTPLKGGLYDTNSLQVPTVHIWWLRKTCSKTFALVTQRAPHTVVLEGFPLPSQQINPHNYFNKGLCEKIAFSMHTENYLRQVKEEKGV